VAGDEGHRVLALDELITGFPHIPPACGASLAQAVVICLGRQGHVPGVTLTVRGGYTTSVLVGWTFETTEAMRRFWNDLEEAAEQGAYGLAILLMRLLTGYTVVERSRKGTGFDWWLGEQDNLFQGKARLEVSGVLRGTARRVSRRVSARKKQTERSDASLLPATIVVVEFGAPQARVVQR
jgi:hypothetical protein